MINLFITTSILFSQNLFAKTFGGTGYDEAYSVSRTTDGGCVVAGVTYSFGTGLSDLLVLKLNPDGSLAWARSFGGTSYDEASSVSQTTDGGYVVAGETWSFGAGDPDFLVLKLNPDGSLAWARSFGGTYYDVAQSVSQTTDGGYVVAGVTTSFGAGDYDLLVLKLNPDGSLAWARSFGGTSLDRARSVSQTTDGGYVVAGVTESFGAGDEDFLVLKLGSDGNYPDCVQSCSPTVMTVSPSTPSPSVSSATCSPSILSPSITVTIPSPIITDVCTPLYEDVEESAGTLPGITCSPVPGGTLFISPEAMAIKIYAADGRLAYSGNLEKGENRITLETGVYLWRAGDCGGTEAPAYPASFGKAVVR